MHEHKTKITLFDGQGDTKIPFSTREDGSFIFATLELSYTEIVKVKQDSYSLAYSYNIQEPILTHRAKLSNVAPINDGDIVDSITFNIKVEDINIEDAINVLRNTQYDMIALKSKQGLTCILKVQMELKYIYYSMMELQKLLGSQCSIKVPNIYDIEKPFENLEVLYERNTNKALHNIMIEKELENTSSMTFIEICLSEFENMGYEQTSIKSLKGKPGVFLFTKDQDKFHFNEEYPIKMQGIYGAKSESIFYLINKTKQGKEWLQNRNKKEQINALENKKSKKSKNNIIINERYLKAEDLKAVTNKFIQTKDCVLKIKSAMGTAKSDVIYDIIKQAHEDGMKIIVVSNRISVAKDFAEKYNMDIYQNMYNSSNSIVVQFDSLHRYNPADYDLVVFDEFMSLLLHHRTSLGTNSNINAIKFKILLQKRVILADAFLTGYEDEFIKDRKIIQIENTYRDCTDLFNYSNKEHFIQTLIDESQKLKDEEHISASFTSLAALKLVYYSLKKKGVKVVKLTSETSEDTRQLIYKRFKEQTHIAFQVILYTPTLTVGVSNVNNVTKHFHYDSSMSCDVISSLQMIKRSRTAKEIHFFLQNRQLHKDIDLESINRRAEHNAVKYYANKDKALLLDVDYETGEMKLTPLAHYINKIEVFNNILMNNHKNAFLVLLSYQFNSAPIEVKGKVSWKMRDLTRQIKEKELQDALSVFDKFKDVKLSDKEVKRLRFKTSELSDEEKVAQIKHDIQSMYSKEIPQKSLDELTRLEIEQNFKFTDKVKLNKIFQNEDDSYAKYELSEAISNNIGMLQDNNKETINFLKYLIINDNAALKGSYTLDDIKRIDFERGKGSKLANFLKSLGYTYSAGKWEVDLRVLGYIKYLD